MEVRIQAHQDAYGSLVYALPIPDEVLREYNLFAGDMVEVTFEPDRSAASGWQVTVKPVKEAENRG